jgi:WD40 repeat protein
MRRPALLTSSAVLLLAACQSGGDGSATRTAPVTEASTRPAVSSGATTASPAALRAPVTATEEADGVRRFGDGRAIFASYDPSADRTVVATTIGLVVQVGDDAPQTLSTDMATMMATSTDGRYAATTTSTGLLRAWDVTTGEQVTAHDVAPDRFTSLTFSGTAVVAGSATEVVRFGLDGSTSELVASGDAALGPVVVADTGDLAVTVAAPVPSVATWTAEGTAATIDLGLPVGSRLTGVRWSRDASQLAVLHARPGEGDSLGIWDVAAGGFTGQVALPNFVEPHQVGFPTADVVVVPNLDRVVAYDLTGSELGSFPVGESAVAAVDVAGGAVLVVRLDGTVTRWAPGGDPTLLAERTVALVDQVGLVRTFGADGSERRRHDRWAVGEATAVDVAADGSLVLATSTGAVRMLDPSGRDVSAAFDRPQGGVSDVSVAPDDGRIATGVSVQKAAEAWDDTIEVTELDSGAAVFSLGGEAENVTGCAFYDANVVFSPDGTVLASTSHDFTLQVSPTGDPDGTIVLRPHRGAILDVDFSPDGSTLVTSAEDGTMRRWDVDGWRLRDELITSPGGWSSMAYSPDGAVLAVSDAAGRISVIDQATATVERTFSGSRAALGDMVFTPDGRSLVAPLPDGSVGVWDLAGGALRDRLPGHTMPVNALAVGPDGAVVITASQDGTVRRFPLPGA